MEYYVVFSAPINNVSSQNLMAACSQIVGFPPPKKATAINLLISTPGGEVPSGLTLYNFLKGLPIPVNTHNIGNVDSIGNAVFLAGKKRLACQHSTFMFHGVGRNAEKIVLEEKNLRETLNAILADQKRIGDIIVSETSITPENAGKLFTEASTKDSDFALKNGIVTADENSRRCSYRQPGHHVATKAHIPALCRKSRVPSQTPVISFRSQKRFVPNSATTRHNTEFHQISTVLLKCNYNMWY